MKKNLVLIVSLVAGLLAAVLTRVYLSAKDAEISRQKEALMRRYGSMTALCFKHDVPGGTVIAKSDLGKRVVPELGMRGQALTEEQLDDIIGRKTLIAHREGDIVFWSDIEGGDPNTRGLSADVKRQMRAISINVNSAGSVSGMVRPNDHVDVIGTFDFPQPDNPKSRKGDVVTCTLLQNVLVLATGNETAKAHPAKDLGGRSSGYATVTLEVTPREAEMLAFAEQMKGRLVLTLRNRNDTSTEKELPNVDFEKIRSEIEELNLKRQQMKPGR